MKYIKLLSVMAIAFALAFSVAKADTLVGSTYVSAVANVTDVRSKLTANNLYGGTVGLNIAAFNHVDVGATLDLARLQDNKVDTSNFKGEFNTTTYTKFLGVKPFARGALGWTFARTGVHQFQAATYRVGVGAETDLLKNLSIGGEFYITDVQKARAGGSQRVYRPYATFWLNDHLGVTGAYVYNQTVNSAGASLGAVFKF